MFNDLIQIVLENCKSVISGGFAVHLNTLTSEMFKEGSIHKGSVLFIKGLLAIEDIFELKIWVS